MKRKITGFDKDSDGDWRAKLECGHYQHVRHKPPLISREWVLSEAGRNEKLGAELDCQKCPSERRLILCKFLKDCELFPL